MKAKIWSIARVSLLWVISTFIGIGIGLIVGYDFKLPDHTVDVFAFVESALGIGLTIIALILTLGILRQRIDFEEMLQKRKEEMETEIVHRIENGLQNKISLLETRMGTQEHILTNQTNPQYVDLFKRVQYLEQNMPSVRTQSALQQHNNQIK